MSSPGFATQTRIVALTDLGRRLRDRSALITAVAAPLALAVVFGTLFSGAGASTFVIGVADASGSPTGTAIAGGLIGSGADGEGEGNGDGEGETGAVVFRGLDPQGAEAAVSDGDVDAAIVLGADDDPSSVALTVIAHAERPFSGDVAQSIADDIAARLDRIELASAGADRLGADPATRAAVVPAAAEITPYRIEPVELGGATVDAMAFFGASMAMVLLFFTTGFAAHSILVDRRTSVLDRMLAVGLRPSALLAGKVLSVAALALIGFGVVWMVTSVGFGARWGAPGPVAVLIVATVAALSGVSIFVASFARTERQSETLASVVTFGLALLGGNFTGPANLPGALERLAGFIPNGVALRAFTEASADAADLASLADALARLAAFAIVFGAIGLVRIRRSIIR